ncbi:DUF2971 domain-containing protein [Leucobacter sp. cx-328]|uniref:DUF2971 domain-containing protein n=1 Tax=unclassified Leucobacter TaxID=2621730 RepID=UPI00165E55E0|nr:MULTISPECIES: DUF2971 domain-containing protein [unclassified Leucobacter]MBC9943797.1 DUF2971 domain-containing protein [Leucobacter sp. cx-328]
MSASVSSGVHEAWHYTTAAGFKGIVENDFLLAGPASQMNDSREIIEGYDAVRTLVLPPEVSSNAHARAELLECLGSLEDAMEAMHSLFSLSASSNGDNLSLWRAYGGAGSYAIRLDHEASLFPIVDVDRLDQRLTKEAIPGLELHEPFPHAAAKVLKDWKPVDYTMESAKKHAKMFDASVASGGLQDWQKKMIEDYKYDLFARIKHSSFSAEEEVRKTFRVAPSLAFDYFLGAGSTLKRFIKVGYSLDQKLGEASNAGDFVLWNCMPEPEKLPILEVKLSPTGHQPSAVETAKSFLALHGHTDIPVSFSASPFTG